MPAPAPLQHAPLPPAPGQRPTRGFLIDPPTAAAAAVVGALVAGTWPLLAPAPGGWNLPLTALTAHVSGMLAGYGVLVLLLLVGRTPALERGVGADVLARWHARTGRAVVVLVLVHAVTAVAGWAQAQGIDPVTATAQVITWPWMPAAALGTVLMLVAAGTSVRAARRAVRHQTWHGTHLLMYAAVALGFGHQLAGPDLAGHPVLQVGWSLAYTYTFALVLRHRVLDPLRQAARHRMRVHEVRPEGPGVVSVVVSGRHLEELGAESGQFFRWRFLTPGHWSDAHPFSLSAAPTPTRLRLTVKALGDGSSGLQHVRVGTRVAAEGPYGSVTSARRTQQNVLLIAGGVGITPMRALFETIPLAPGQDLLLLYRARHPGEVIFGHELDALARARGARVHYALGSDRSLMTAEGLLASVPDLVHRDVYLCGPPGLTVAVRGALRRAGLPRHRLHEERFDL